MAGRLQDKVAVVTGGASGIGEGTVRRFVEEGASVVIADIQDERGKQLAAELGDATRFVHCDVTVEDHVAEAVRTATGEFGRIDVMFNNAGIVGVTGSIIGMPTEAWDNTVNVLLRSVFFGMKHAGGPMAEQGSGSIISTASTAGVAGGLGPHVYTAAKHGVVGLTKSVANEMAPLGIRVNAVAPGNTVSAMTAAVTTGDADNIELATERIGAVSLFGQAAVPADIANAALYLASDESRFVTGHTLVVDSGQTSSGTVLNRFNTGDNRQFHEAGRIT